MQKKNYTCTNNLIARNERHLHEPAAAGPGGRAHELFIEKVSAFLSEKTDSRPENGERIAAGLVSLAESLKDELFLREIFAAQSRSGSDPDGTLASRIEELNETLRELTAALKQHP